LAAIGAHFHRGSIRGPYRFAKGRSSVGQTSRVCMRSGRIVWRPFWTCTPFPLCAYLKMFAPLKFPLPDEWILAPSLTDEALLQVPTHTTSKRLLHKCAQITHNKCTPLKLVCTPHQIGAPSTNSRSNNEETPILMRPSLSLKHLLKLLSSQQWLPSLNGVPPFSSPSLNQHK
jgi:hypothetical protein